MSCQRCGPAALASRALFVVLVLLLACAPVAGAQGQAVLAGVVFDPLGARIQGATVTLVGGRQPGPAATSGADGGYQFANVEPGRYQVVARAAGFAPITSGTVYLAAGSRVALDVTLQVSPLQQAVVVTASAAPAPQSQTGAPVTVLDQPLLDVLGKPDLLEALRLVPGTQVEQTGGKGGTTSVMIRGGTSSFTKVLIDGVAANDIGGFFEFSPLQTTGIEQVEVLRQTNSVMYGSDALTGVINLTTRRGRSRIPELSYAVDGGSLGTFHNALSVGGAHKRVDYFSEYSYFTTDNDVPNSEYRNHTFAGRVGLALGSRTDLSGTLRHIDTFSGSPNGITLYGIADDSSSEARSTYAGMVAQSQWTDRWQSTVRVGSTDQTSTFLNPTPTGTPVDPFGFGANYLGNVVTMTGANGYATTGRAILDFGGVYPSIFDTRFTRRAISGQTTYMVAPGMSIAGGARFEREAGFDDPDGDATETRNNGGVFVEGRGALGGRTYVTAGLGYEHNEVFTSATTPRFSIASYLREPTAGALGDTKLTFNIGKGIKAPSVSQGMNSLLTFVEGTPAASGVEPIGPERSRTLDLGVEQGFLDGQVRVRLSYFHNDFDDLIEFLDKSVLLQFGVPPEVVQATAFGAYVNSSSFTAQGVETSADALLMTRLRLMASYTFTDAEVTESFASDALPPTFNPSIPGVPIGVFSPLVGQRPFRRPTHAGTLLASYVQGRAQITLAGYFSGKRDSSTFLGADEFFGSSMLLPNQDLEAAYQKMDLSGAYRVHPRLKLYLSIENLLDKQYESAFGFPSLPRTARAGVSVAIGGDGQTRTP